MRVAVFTDIIDPKIKNLWNRINLALYLKCLPSDIDKQSNKDIEAIMIILNAREEKNKRDKEMENVG